MVDALGDEVVLLITPPGKDEFGDPLPGGETTERVPGCMVYPHTSSEADGRAGTILEGYTALLPIPWGAIKPETKARWNGRTFKIEGLGGDWRYLDGEGAGIQIELTEGSG